MQVGSVNVIPQSANHMIVSLNGTIQKPNSSFTVSGSTITFSSNLATGDVIDFIQILGDVLDLGVPSDATVTTAKLAGDAVTEAKIADGAVESEHLNNNIISGQTALATAPADTDEFLVSDAGTLKRIDYSLIKGGGAMELLHTATGSNVSTIDINGYFTSDYDHYKVIYSVYASTGNTDTRVRIMQGGSIVTATNYRYVGSGWYFDGSTSQSQNQQGWNDVYWLISSTDNTNDSQSPTTGEMLLSNPLSTSQNTTFTTTSIGYNSPSPPSAVRNWTFVGTYVSTTATSGISFYQDGGNVNGTIRLYGMKNS
jgi:hypothetical protein